MTMRTLLLAAIVLAGCAGDDGVGPVCGNGVCDPGEHWQTCSDCQRCPSDCPAGYSCQYPGGCARTPRTYHFMIDEASLPATRFDGSPWDADAGIDAAPDPYAVLILDPSLVASSATPSIANTVEPRWNTPSVEYSGFFGLVTVQLEVYDDDGPTHELVVACSGQLDVVPNASFRCSADGGSIHLTVGP